MDGKDKKDAGLVAPTGVMPLEVMLDAWDRNNTILKNLLQAVPDGGMEVRATPDAKSVREMFLHMHGTRVFFLSEDAPEFALPFDEESWFQERDPERIAAALDASARAMRDAVEHSVTTGKALRVRFDHPVLFLVHLIWHEGYHHGQIKLALKAAGMGLEDEVVGRVTWDLFMEKGGSKDGGASRT